MTTWATPFIGKPYHWPEYYCGAMLHAAILAETGLESEYPRLAARAYDEKAMIIEARRRWGSVGAAHVVTMSRAYARLAHPTRAKAAWCPIGRLTTVDGHVTEPLSDMRGVMLIRQPLAEGQDWYMWSSTGVVLVYELGRCATIGWTW